MKYDPKKDASPRMPGIRSAKASFDASAGSTGPVSSGVRLESRRFPRESTAEKAFFAGGSPAVSMLREDRRLYRPFLGTGGHGAFLRPVSTVRKRSFPMSIGPAFRSERKRPSEKSLPLPGRSHSVGSPVFYPERETWNSRAFREIADGTEKTAGVALLGLSRFFHEAIVPIGLLFSRLLSSVLSAVSAFGSVSGHLSKGISSLVVSVVGFLSSASASASSATGTALLGTARLFRQATVPMRSLRALSAMAAIVIVVGGGFGVRRFAEVKGQVLGESIDGVTIAADAVNSLASADFLGSSERFADAYRSFSSASDSLGTVGNELAKAARFVPGLSMVSSGQGLLEGARYLSAAGVSMSGILKLLPSSSDLSEGEDISFLGLIGEAETRSAAAEEAVTAAVEAFDRVRPEDVPEEYRETFVAARENLPFVAETLGGFNRNAHLIRELLGENGPRMYLFLFQNNAELRPTGGFIGSYGLLDVTRGRIRNFFVDGIFNPDGQLKENVVPPSPVQKVSTAWSLHDSNWWPDFPTSAEKAIFFYEKTGGPTVDGVVTFTPMVIREALRLTGPIDMPEYGVTIDADNFLEVVQEEVEENYDRELNRPKQILSDLAPILLDRLFSSRSADDVLSLAGVLSKALDEKQVLLYSRNDEIEGLIDSAGWSGRMLDTPKDYLSVVHTNLNGYKTDAVVSEDIAHEAVIEDDGSVLDTVRITRKHNGGDTPYDWFNRVNSDYLRVYVPKGSELVSVSGQTYEFPKPPIDYDAVGFRRDDDVERDEHAVRIDRSGTRVGEESGKTVFGNWVYVSPGESVTVEYVYRLPFRVVPEQDAPASYSVLFQKQAGTEGVPIVSEISVPGRFRTDWVSDDVERSERELSFRSTLSSDEYYGAVFSVRQ